LTDPSLKPDPDRKGSYYRRIEDIDRALQKLDVQHLPPGPRLLAYFFGCEKLAHGIVGICAARPASDQYSHRSRLCLNDIKVAAVTMNLVITPADVDWIFAEYNEQHLLIPAGTARASARHLRNNMTHDFGPTNADNLVQHADFLTPKMIILLGCAKDVLAYLHANFQHVA
jgi:hypothetical protein